MALTLQVDTWLHNSGPFVTKKKKNSMIWHKINCIT